MSALETTPSSLRTVELSFVPADGLLSHDFMDRRKDFLHDGRPESTSKQVYDWNLLRAFVLEHANVESVVFSMPQLWAGKWRKCPKTVRVLRETLPGVKVEFGYK